MAEGYEREWTPGQQDRVEWLRARDEAPASAYDFNPSEDYDPEPGERPVSQTPPRARAK